MDEKKKYKNSIMIEGNYNFNYLCNLMMISSACLSNIMIVNKDLDKKTKKIIDNLQSFYVSSYGLLGKLSERINEPKCIIREVFYNNNDC